MKELAVLLLCSVVSYTCAARLPYLGGDIQDLLEQAKRSDLLIQKHEKQAPHVAFSQVPIKLRTQEERNRISRLNMRARHRNTYFDGAGGNPFNGGGVLSIQNAISRKKHRRRRSAYSYDRPVYGSYYDRPTTYDRYYYDSDYLLPMMIRQRRGSSMPYLGQNLDTLGVIRAIPRGWAPPQKKSKQTKKDNAAIPDPSMAAYARAAGLPGVEMKPAMFNSWMSPAFRATIPQPMAMLPPPYAMNYGQVLPNQQNQLYPEFRNMVPQLPPAYYSAMAAMGQSPLFPSPIRSFMPERSPSAEQAKISTTDTAKKSVIPERPDPNIVSSSTSGANPAGVPDTSSSSFTGSTAPSSLTGSTVPGNSASSYTGSSIPSINNLLENSAANYARSNIPGDSSAATSLPGMSASSYTGSSIPESSPPAGNLPGNSASSFARSSITGSNPASSGLPGSTASSYAGGSLAGSSLQNNNLPGGTASTMAGSALAGRSAPGSNPAGNTNDEMRWVTPQ